MNKSQQQENIRHTPSIYSDDGDIENDSGSDNDENEDDNDGDNEIDGQGSDEGGNNENKSGQSSWDESELSGSEDSSDMDVEECEKKRFEYIDDLTDLERQFAILREQLYRQV